MAFQSSLSQLVTQSDEQNVLWHKLLKSIYDHGGSTNHLNALLKDAKGSRIQLDKIARLIVGRAWELVEGPLDLGLTKAYYRLPAHEVVSRARRQYDMDARFLDGNWTETKPKRFCRYRLHHFDTPHSFTDVNCAFLAADTKIEHASWRELFAYAGRLELDGLTGCKILAAGSRLYESEDRYSAEGLTFPCAREDELFGFVMSWKGVKDLNTDKFGPDCFFLVRVYD